MAIPLHFSSYFMLFFAMAAFGRGRVREIGVSLSFVSTVAYIISFYLYPRGIVGSGELFFTSFNRAHSFIYHMMFIQFFAFIVALDLFRARYRDLLWVLGIHFVLMTISLGAAIALNTNFANFQGGTGVFGMIADGMGMWQLRVLIFVGVLGADIIVFLGAGLPYSKLRERYATKSPVEELLVEDELT